MNDDTKDPLHGIRIVTDFTMPADSFMLVNVDAAHRVCPGCKNMMPFRSFTDVVNGVVRDICAQCRERDDRQLFVLVKGPMPTD